MKVFGRLIFIAVLTPLSVILIIFAIANRHFVEIFFYPLDVTISLPLYWVVFFSWFFGLIVGIFTITFTLLRSKRSMSKKQQRERKLIGYPTIAKPKAQENQ